MKYLKKISSPSEVDTSLTYDVIYYNDKSGEITIKEYKTEPEYEMVSLGLSVKWASMNVGAKKPTDYGLYFQWADSEGAEETPPTTSKNYSWETTPYYVGTESGGGSGGGTQADFSKYNGVDGKVVLDATDDAATKLWGSAYRIPTKEECQELLDYCTYQWVTDYQNSGVNGALFTSRVEGHTNDKIFIPAAGVCVDGVVDDVGEYGDVWSSSLDTDYPKNAFSFYFNSVDYDVYYDYRYGGLSVRAVSKDLSFDPTKLPSKNNGGGGVPA